MSLALAMGRQQSTTPTMELRMQETGTFFQQHHQDVKFVSERAMENEKGMQAGPSGYSEPSQESDREFKMTNGTTFE